MTLTSKPIKIAVFASHRGSKLQFLWPHFGSRFANCHVDLVLSNNENAEVLRFAAENGIPNIRLSSKTHPDPNLLDQAICDVLIEREIALVMLLGYMKLLGPRTCQAFRGRIVNIHPSLLPHFGGTGMYGSAVHKAVISSGAAQSGATLHLADCDYDTGATVAQQSCTVSPLDTAAALAEKVSEIENTILLRFLDDLDQQRIALPIARRTAKD